MAGFYYGGWAPYVPVAERRRKAERKLAALRKKGRICEPVAIQGRTIARTFWGKNWCDNLEAYSDYANRLPRGRTYVRNGSVVDLQIAPGKISALVAGSEVYQVDISVRTLEDKLWQAVLHECAGKIDSLVELLQGRLSDAVMKVVTRHGSGLFPMPKQISFRCSCPDSASMCKHVAAVLYGVGARFDSQPELLFRLRQVDPQELIRQTAALGVAETGTGHQQLEGADLSALFGIDLDEPVAAAAALSAAPATPARTQPSRSEARRAGTGRFRAAKSEQAAQPAQPARKATPNALKVPPAPKTKRPKTLSASELVARGIPRHMIQSWLDSEVMLRTAQRGIYGATKETEKRIDAYLKRRGKAA